MVAPVVAALVPLIARLAAGTAGRAALGRGVVSAILPAGERHAAMRAVRAGERHAATRAVRAFVGRASLGRRALRAYQSPAKIWADPGWAPAPAPVPAPLPSVPLPGPTRRPGIPAPSGGGQLGGRPPTGQDLLRTLAGVDSISMKFSLSLARAALASEKFASVIAESRRHLAPYSGRIAGGFARLDRQAFRLDRRTAQDTGGSTVLMLDELRKLREELRPIQDKMTTAINLLGATAAGTGRFLLMFGKAYPKIAALLLILGLIEQNTKKDGGKSVAQELFDAVRDDKFHRNAPNNPPLPPLN